MSLQIRSVKEYLTFVNYRLLSKVKINCNYFCFKDPGPQILTSSVVSSFGVEYAMNPITENVLDLLLLEVADILSFRL